MLQCVARTCMRNRTFVTIRAHTHTRTHAHTHMMCVYCKGGEADRGGGRRGQRRRGGRSGQKARVLLDGIERESKFGCHLDVEAIYSSL